MKIRTLVSHDMYNYERNYFITQYNIAVITLQKKKEKKKKKKKNANEIEHLPSWKLNIFCHKQNVKAGKQDKISKSKWNYIYDETVQNKLEWWKPNITVFCAPNHFTTFFQNDYLHHYSIMQAVWQIIVPICWCHFLGPCTCILLLFSFISNMGNNLKFWTTNF